MKNFLLFRINLNDFFTVTPTIHFFGCYLVGSSNLLIYPLSSHTSNNNNYFDVSGATEFRSNNAKLDVGNTNFVLKSALRAPDDQ